MLKSKAQDFLIALCPTIQYIDGIETKSIQSTNKSNFLKSADGKVMLTQARSHLTPAQRNILNMTNASSPRRSKSATHKLDTITSPDSNYFVNNATKSTPPKLVTVNNNDSPTFSSSKLNHVNTFDSPIIRSKSSDQYSPSFEPISIFKSSSKSSRSFKRILPHSPSDNKFSSQIHNEQLDNGRSNKFSNKASTDAINIWFGESEVGPLAASLNSDGTGFMRYFINTYKSRLRNNYLLH
jgi:hypothetical protein